jgi:hypothetical protein
MKPFFRGLGFFVSVPLLLTGCNKSAETEVVNSPDVTATSPQPKYFKTHFQDESQYIVETVLSDVAEMAFYARSQKLPSVDEFSVEAMEKPGSVSGAPIYRCQIRFSKSQAPLKFELPVNRAIWSPEVYAAATKMIFDSLAIEAGKTSEQNEDTSMLDDLTDGKAKTIEELNQNLSSALEKDFRNPALHEKAALVLGALFCGKPRENSTTSARHSAG